jgi:hypothetical protein
MYTGIGVEVIEIKFKQRNLGWEQHQNMTALAEIPYLLE